MSGKSGKLTFLTSYFEQLGGDWGNELNKYMNVLLSEVKAVLEGPRTAEGREFISRWAGQWYEPGAALELVIPTFCICELCLAPSMPRELVRNIIRVIPPDKQLVHDLVIKYYAKKRWAALTAAVKGWGSNPIFKPRMFIFGDALDAHKQGKWTLSVPTLLPQVEGIAIDILTERGLDLTKKSVIIAKGTKKKAGRTLASQVFSLLPIDAFSLSEMVAIYTLLYYLEGRLYSPIGSPKEPSPLEEPDSFNRHAILHGVQINYASKMNSLMCFLILDTLQLAARAFQRYVPKDAGRDNRGEIC